MTPEEYQKHAADCLEIEVDSSGKRCGVQHDPWMGDWFTSWSPRNDNSNAEGPWEHWVDLARRILQDPMTAIVRPDAHAIGQQIAAREFYGDCDRRLTEAELLARFATTASDL